ncbi:unnamed protein product [Cercospora beticola]|nr:unnamed protein product [Cercospora beticola]
MMDGDSSMSEAQLSDFDADLELALSGSRGRHTWLSQRDRTIVASHLFHRRGPKDKLAFLFNALPPSTLQKLQQIVDTDVPHHCHFRKQYRRVYQMRLYMRHSACGTSNHLTALLHVYNSIKRR